MSSFGTVFLISIISALAIALAFIIYRIVTRPKQLKQIEKDIQIRYYSKAIEELKNILKREPENHMAHRLLAKALHESGNPKASIEEYRHALKGAQIESFTYEKETRYSLGLALKEAGIYAEAVEEFLLLIQIDERNFDALMRLSECFIELKRWTKAAEILTLAVDINRKDEQAWYSLGFSYYMEQSFSRSASALSQVVSLNSKNADAQYYLGMALQQTQDYSRALDHLKNAAKKSDYKLNSLYTMGICHYHLGNMDSLKKVLLEGIKSGSTSDRVVIDMHYLLGLAFENEKQYGSAIEHFEVVAASDASYKDIQSKLDQYSNIRNSDKLRTFVTSSEEQFKDICLAMMSRLHYDTQDQVQLGDEQNFFIGRVKDNMIGKGNNHFVVFNRMTEALEENDLRALLEKMQKNNAQEVKIFTSTPINSQADKFIATRPVEVYGPETINELLSENA